MYPIVNPLFMCLLNQKFMMVMESSNHYNTRSKAQVENEESGTGPQLIHFTGSASKGFTLAAGSEKGQLAFLQAVGMISSVPVDTEPILNEEHAQLICCDLSHFQVEEDGLTDPYFTKEEWHKVVCQRKSIMSAQTVLLKDFIGKVALNTPIKESDFMEKAQVCVDTAETTMTTPLCNCIAHQDGQYYGELT